MIPVAELHDLLLVELDKYGNPYFTDSEIDGFLNRAIIGVVKDVFDNYDVKRQTGGKMNVGYEHDSSVSMDLSDLVTEASGAMSILGVITRAQIDAIIGGGRTYLRIISLQTELNGFLNPAMFLRNHERARFKTNYYTAPGDCTVYYSIQQDRLLILPDDELFDYSITVLREPVKVSLSGAVNSDLGYAMRERVITRAFEIASVSIRDQEGLLMEKSTTQVEP